VQTHREIETFAAVLADMPACCERLAFPRQALDTEKVRIHVVGQDEGARVGLRGPEIACRLSRGSAVIKCASLGRMWLFQFVHDISASVYEL
jgi:hypothetical protein